MSSVFPPLKCESVKKILKNLGFDQRPGKGTSHEQWVKYINNRIYKVTVDCPKSPFSPFLVESMAKQAGVTKKQFYAALK